MNISRFFIDRPIFAWVIAIVIMLAGLLSIFVLPIEQYPRIALPQVTVNASYPGASAKIVEDSVTQVIEQSLTGLDHLKYMTSNSSAGSASVTLVFEAGTDPDFAQVQVQNQVQSALRRLPQDVQQQGLRVNKASGTALMAIAFYTDDNSLSNADIGDWIASHLNDPISRLDGVGDTRVFGSQYAMRIWLNADELASYALTPADIATAIQAQNTQVSAGSIGADPALPDTALNATITAQSQLQTPGQFENIIVKNNPDGTPVRLKDVARVELGPQSYGNIARMNGHLAAGIQVSLATGANALKTADEVKALLTKMEPSFPAGLKYAIPNDSTQFVKLSIEDVVKTLIEAVVLVFVVMFLFLQNWRATLIPAIAVPVVLLGTFGILAAFGYSINTLTMFGLVLAIGLLVDDAIVVVENVERVMAEEGLEPKEATRRSMDEITGALIGVASVLAAMFVPMAFFGGTQGIIYRQFSVTLVSAMVLSVIVALVLTPPLCATLLHRPKPGEGIPPAEEGDEDVKVKGVLSAFNRGFQVFAHRYQMSVRGIIRKPGLFMLIYGAIIAAVVALAITLPTSFLPDEDQGMLTTIVQLPVGSTTAQTLQVLDKVQAVYQKDKAVQYVFAIAGFSFAGSGENQGMVICRMKDFKYRHAADMKVQAVVARARKSFAQIHSATIIPTIPPPVRELGNASGFDLELKDVNGQGHDALAKARDQLVALANRNPVLAGVRANGQDDTPQLHIDIDNTKVGALGVKVSDVNAMLSTALGGTYVNDFIDRGRIKRVYIQGDAQFRTRPEDINRWFVRNASGQMVPFSAFGTSSWTFGPPQLQRYNGSGSMEIQGTAAPGQSNGKAMQVMEDLVKQLPGDWGYEWTGLSLQEQESGQQAPALYALSLLVVFLLLAALYESWSIPFAVIFVVPLGIFGALVGTWLRGLDNDIYFQVGLLATMGLAAKNAILIVEFAKILHEEGRTLVAATLEAVRIRLRPIIMTSLAFTFGIMPLALANSAGSSAQHAIGTGLIGGVLAATFLAIFFVPLFFVLVQRLFRQDRLPQDLAAKEANHD
ncbi:efflux RND transporter permease subunit [Asticcacaulis sp. EMRT-3]|uniref:efflux RND transporter permease subunit n=1 Tax=Asticcacaulis sp. EMRT-3 TaxID=3040349 RepID=UPI0024AF1864|nr:efflux RND transporter permease subunit [Asticcacaulis sp. EMRT-3]MDI7776473.1 efflux RND transporter permease subunit [Asticcacaulis sp. EMRT-3]